MPEPSPSFAGPAEMIAAIQVVRLSYFERRSNVQIADELGMTRFKVARLLEVARATGLVRITITGPGTLDLDLSQALCERFGLRHSVVVHTAPVQDSELRDQIGAVAAELLTEICVPDDVLGLGWARVVLAMEAHLGDLSAARIVQLTGALSRPDTEASSMELVRDVAQRVGAQSSVFYAPMVVSDLETALALHRQPQVADAVARFDSVTKAVVGVGGWSPPHSTLHDALTPSDRDLLRGLGVHADLSGVLLDDHGAAVQTPLSDRIIAISAEQLRRVPEVIGIAYGLDKVSAARAGIRGGYLNGLVTHTAFAERLLDEGP